MSISIVILAAGLGKRMRSALPKVLHTLAGKPLLEHVVQTATKLDTGKQPIVVYGHQGDRVRHALADLNVNWVLQEKQLGTGHALQQTLPHLPSSGRVLILYGDVPLIQVETLKHFIIDTPEHSLGIITTELPDPHGFGRIIRNQKNKITAIVEEKDATDRQRCIVEINSGIYLIPVVYLRKWLPKLTNKNTQKEFYLTDLIQYAVKEEVSIHSIQPQQYEEILGVNDCFQLACLERVYQEQAAEKLLFQGVKLLDPHRFDIRGEVSIGQDVVIDINVILEGHVKLGNRVTIGPNTILRNAVIGDDVEIKANSIVDGAEISDKCIIGPFARIRPGTVLSSESHIGNFVEIKNSVIGTKSKVNHLSYIGDSEVGSKVNIGAGTITCNYDGVNKYKTTIGDDAFIGSNTELVAPVTVGEGATIGAGSTITHDAPPNQLTLCRAEQTTIAHWQRPKKKEKKEKEI